MADGAPVDSDSGCEKPEWKRCPKCPFGSRGKAVGYRGDPNSPIMMVLESPGVDEVIEGLPIVGVTGQLTQELIPTDNVDRDCFVTNSLRCLPPKSKKTQTIMKTAVAACRERLIEEMQMAPRKVILAFGAGALWGTTGNFGLKPTEERGHIFESPYAEHGILATVHPAYLLRGGGSLRQLREDIHRGFDLAKDVKPKPLTNVKWTIYNTVEGIREAVAHLRLQKILAADLETTGLDRLEDKILALGIAYTPTDVVIFPREVFESPELLNELRPLFDDPKPQWLWHNGKFDCAFLRRKDYGFTKAHVDQDTMLLSYARDENKGLHDLETLGNDVLGWPPYKFMAKQYLVKGGSFADIPRDTLHEYLAYDCGSTYQAFFGLLRRVKRPRIMRAYKKTLIPSSEFFLKTETRGMLVDYKALEKADTELLAEMAGYRQQLRDLCGRPNYNPNAWQQSAEIIYDQFGIRHPTKPGLRSTDKDTLAKLPDHPFLRALSKYKTAAKAHGTYVGRVETRKGKQVLTGMRRYIGKDDRIHSTIKIHGTTTGRPASSEPNILNIPRDPRLRGIFRAPDGYVLIDSDVNQAELRVLAMCSGDEYLTELYKSGVRKLHDEMADFLFGDRWRTAVGQEKENLKMRAKAVNFGIPYGRTAISIAYEHDVPEPVAQSWVDAWFRRAPKAAAFIEAMRQAPLDNKIIWTVFGRERRLGVISNQNRGHILNEASNFPIQSISSDIVLHTGMRAQPILEKEGIYMINFVYDSLLSECPEDPDMIKFARDTVERCMNEVVDEMLDTDIPFIMEHKITRNWGNLDTAVKIAA